MNLGIANRIVVSCSEDDETLPDMMAYGPYSAAVCQFSAGLDDVAHATLEMLEDCAPTLRCLPSPVSSVVSL